LTCPRGRGSPRQRERGSHHLPCVSAGRSRVAGRRYAFRQAIDALADAIANSLRARGIDPDALAYAGANEHGSLLTMSSDAPAWAAYFWIYLPAESAAQAALMPIILDHPSRARNAAPDAT
jgi:hypothetical protein